MVGDVIDRCPTGIIGFDKICQGGFVRNSDNLIVGGPGSGKSTFLLQFLWNGVSQFNENGLYCSFEPDIVDTLNDAMAYGWDFTKMSAEGKMKFMRFAPQTSIEELKGELAQMISKNNIKRICFDPISVLALNSNDSGKMRQTIFDLSALMKRFKVTTVFSDESLEEGIWASTEGEWTKTDILRFLSDSVSVFYESAIAEEGDRAVRIVKMRRTRHERRAIGMTITDKGINVFAPHSGLEKAPAQVDKKEQNSLKFDATPQVPMRLGLPSTSNFLQKNEAISKSEKY
jgi:circadian clock protein KaiC